VSSPIEFVRSAEILERFLPPAPSRVLDVGGAAGRYSSWLAAKGHHVDLVDPVLLHVEQAREASDAGDHPFGVHRGDARDFNFADSSFDAVLLMGPLYHLIERRERLSALREAVRVTKAGGVVIAAAISRFASLLDGFATGDLSDPAFSNIVARDLASGIHRNPDGRPEWFTTAYFHRPEELSNEIAEADLILDELLGVEGPGWLTAGPMKEGDVPEAVLRAARALEREPSTLGISAHWLAVAHVRGTGEP
jgi:SAM-dependent methyltransferase